MANNPASARQRATPCFVAGQTAPCPLCRNSDTSTTHFPLLAKPFEHCPPWPAHEKSYCPSCQYMWSESLASLDLAAYGSEYVKSNTDAERIPNPRMKASPQLLDRLLAWTGGRRFLDYGIGYNIPYVDQVRQLGIDLWGCDICDAVPYGGHVVKLPEQLAVLGEASFDGIFSQDVVEHFNDPVNDFRRLRSLVKPGGLILASTPVLENVWDGNNPVSRHIWLWTPWHTSICSSQAMRLLAKQADLEFIATVPVPTDTKWAFLLRRPGQDGEPANLDAVNTPRTRLLRAALQGYATCRDWN